MQQNPCLVLSAYDDHEYIQAMLDVGVGGIFKDEALNWIIRQSGDNTWQVVG
jgi:DNA-binding NarL/FixJ family response regulator